MNYLVVYLHFIIKLNKMTKFIGASHDEVKKEKKETVFTHYLSKAEGFISAHSQPHDYFKVIYLGKTDYGDMFVAYHKLGYINIYKGTKGDEFDN